jgi:hypothetical protein
VLIQNREREMKMGRQGGRRGWVDGLLYISLNRAYRFPSSFPPINYIVIVEKYVLSSLFRRKPSFII